MYLFFTMKVGCPSEDELEELSIMLSDNWGKFGRRLGFAQARITAFHKENEKLSDKAYAYGWSGRREKGAMVPTKFYTTPYATN